MFSIQQLIFGLVAIFVLLPLGLVIFLKVAARVIADSQDSVATSGLRMSPTTARLGMILLIIGPFSLFQPGILISVAGMATIVLPIIILCRLLLAIGQGIHERHDNFWAGFWRFADPVPLLCGVLVIALVPVTITKLNATADHQQQR